MPPESARAGEDRQHRTASRRLGRTGARRCAVVVGLALPLLTPAALEARQAGKDGPLVVAAPGTIVNAYAELQADAAAGALSLSVNLPGGPADLAPAGLTAGDLLLVVQMQGASIDTTDTPAYGTITGYNGAGLWELVSVAGPGVGGPAVYTIPLAGFGLQNGYTASGNAQVVKVPQYSSLTVNGGASITAPPWAPGPVWYGGVVAMDVQGTATINGDIQVTALGFRGGTVDGSSALPGTAIYRSADSFAGAPKGESIAGPAASLPGGQFGRGAPANGGGGGNAHDAPGGGGANARSVGAWTGQGNPDRGPGNIYDPAWNLDPSLNALSVSSGGGRGGYTFSESDQDALAVAPGDTAWLGDDRREVGGLGGHPLAYDLDLTRVFLGGGGGAGEDSNGFGGGGGRGGGIVFLWADTVTGTGSVLASGEAGQDTSGPNHWDAPGGAGGGGAVVVEAGSSLALGSVVANGGTGGSQGVAFFPEAQGAGGGGGGGYVWLRAPSIAAPASVAGGANGTTAAASLAEFPPNGGTRGAAGRAVSGSCGVPGPSVATFTNATAASGLGTAGDKDGGLSWGDFNDDGCLDVLVNTLDAAIDSRLYMQDTTAGDCDGTFTDVSACLAPGLANVTADRSAIWGDLNNDGDLDFVRNQGGFGGPIEIYLNNGPGGLGGACGATSTWSMFGIVDVPCPGGGCPNQTITASPWGFDTEGLGFVDFDNNGVLDIIADNNFSTIVLQNADGTGANLQPINPTNAGLPTTALGNKDYLAVADLDVDGDVDVLDRGVTGDIDIWMNVGGSYVAGTFDENAQNTDKGGVAFCDFDDDGDLDVFWTNNGTNQAWRNNGGTDAAVTWTAMGALPAGTGIDGVACGDIDNDGDLDLVLTSWLPDYLFRNDGGFTFVDVSPAGFGATDGEGTAFGDYDRDGDLDVLINQDTANELWRNEINDRDYLMVRALTDPDGAGPAVDRDALGATARLYSCEGSPLSGTRQLDGGSGHGTQDAARMHFGLRGLSGAFAPYEVRVQFVGGTVVRKALIPGSLGCYQEVVIRSTDADDLSVCAATAVDLVSFEAAPGDSSVELAWRTGSELENLGFHVHRSSSEGGPWTRVTASLIPGLGSSPEGASYSWTDTGLQNGTRYFYRLEDVDAASVSTFHGPVPAVPQAAAPPEGGEPAPPEGGEPAPPEGEAAPPGGVEPPPEAPTPPESGSPPPLAEVSEPNPDPCSTCPRTYGDPSGATFRVLCRSASGMTVELRTPGFVATPGEAGARVSVPGFDEPSDPSAPALAFKRAVLPGVVGRSARVVSVQAADVLSFPDLTPAAVGEPAMDVAADGTVRPLRVPAPLDTSSGAVLPTEPVVVASPAFLGETKKLSLEMNPLRFDTAAGELLLARTLTAEIAFDGAPTALETGSGSRGRRVPRSLRRGSADVLAYLHTAEAGLYAVSFDALFPARQRPISVSSLTLTCEGDPVPFHVEPPSRLLRSGSRLVFFASKEASSTDFSPETAYVLELGRGGIRMGVGSAAPVGDPVSVSPLASSRFETNRIYQAGLLQAPDIWLWEGANGGASRTVFFSLEGVDLLSDLDVQVRVHLQGASDSGTPDEHHVSLTLNGVSLGDRSFEGKLPYVFEETVDVSALLEGENTLTLTNRGDTGVYSLVFLDRIALRFPQTPQLRGGRLEGELTESGVVTVSGSAQVAVDVTDPQRPVWLSGMESRGGSVRLQTESGHRYVVASVEGLRSPRIVPPQRSGLKNPANQADYVLIAPEAFLNAAQPLLQRREDQGLETFAASFEEIAAVFGHGRPSAQAIRDFLAYAFHAWQAPSLRYVVLFGDASYDPRNFTGRDRGAPLPAQWTKTSYMWTASDPLLAAVNGDDSLPDIALGRIPVTTVAEAEALVQKILDWEDSGQGLGGDAVLVADDPDQAGDFEADVEDIRAGFLGDRPAQTLKVRELQGATRRAILGALDAGASFISYVGHGGAAVWARDNVLNSWDPPALLAQGQQPLMLTMNCLNGYFVAPNYDALAEAFLKIEGRGTIAAFSPSGLSLDVPAHQFHRALMDAIVNGGHERLGDAVLAAQADYAATGLMPELLGIYHLFGDPGMRIR